MSTHTPGPWKFDEENNYGGSVWLGGTNVTVGLDRCDRFTGELVISRDEMRANGRLIASAPDLLAALKELEEAWVHVRLMPCDGKSHGPYPTEECEECGNASALSKRAEAARAAIAKAEGREPTRKPTEQERLAEAKAKHEDAMLERRRGL